MTDTSTPADPILDRSDDSGRSLRQVARAADTAVLAICLGLTGILLPALLAMVIYGIIGREWLPGGSPSWTNEIAGWLLVWTVLVGAALSVREEAEPSVRFVIDRLPSRAAFPVSCVIDAIALCAFLYLIWYGVQDVELVHSGTGPASGLSLGWLAASVPAGAAFMAYFKLRRFAQHGWRGAVVLVMAAGLGWLVVQHRIDIGTNGFYGLSLGCLLFFLMLGLPIAESMIVSAVIAQCVTSQFTSNVTFVQQISDGLNNFTFVAIPLFLLTGALIARTGAAGRLVAFARSLIGWLPGGLAVADIAASAIFADISGSPVSDTVALGSSMIPQLETDGYPLPFAAGMQAAAGTLGVMFPPSISILIYASVADVSVSKQFAALLIPGLLVMGSFMAVAVLIASKKGWGTRTRFHYMTVAKSGWSSLPALLTIVVVLGGIFSGTFTSSEAGAVAATYILVIAVLGYRQRGKAFLIPAFADAIRNSGRVGLIIGGALAYGQALIANNGPQDLVNALGAISHSKYALLTILLLALIVVNTVLEPSTTPLVVVPVLIPILNAAGVDLVHFGVLLQIDGAIALILPPLGLCLFVVASIVKVKAESAARWVFPFIGALMVDMMLVMFVAPLTSWLPSLVHA